MTRNSESHMPAGLSRPLRLLARDGLLRGDNTLLDYGCGNGDHVACLRHNGLHASGWDPEFLPHGARVAADIVNLGYVLNVLSGEEQQREVLCDAWSLARRLLVVSIPVSPCLGFPSAGAVTAAAGDAPCPSHTWLVRFVEDTLGTRGESAGFGVVY